LNNRYTSPFSLKSKQPRWLNTGSKRTTNVDIESIVQPDR
jgi:hypothetical protein